MDTPRMGKSVIDQSMRGRWAVSASTAVGGGEPVGRSLPSGICVCDGWDVVAMDTSMRGKSVIDQSIVGR